MLVLCLSRGPSKFKLCSEKTKNECKSDVGWNLVSNLKMFIGIDFSWSKTKTSKPTTASKPAASSSSKESELIELDIEKLEPIQEEQSKPPTASKPKIKLLTKQSKSSQ